MPSIGYGSNRKTRHLMPDGFKKFVVHNLKVYSSFVHDVIAAMLGEFDKILRLNSFFISFNMVDVLFVSLLTWEQRK